jgi:uncharacterized protein YqeY
MTLEEKIKNDYASAMKARDSLKSSVLNFLRAAMMNEALDKKKKVLDDPEVVSVIRKQIKSRQDSVEQFTKGGRVEMADKEAQEIGILKEYLPVELAPEEIKRIIAEAVSATGAAGLKDMGKVMKEVNVKVAGRADGKVVSDMVKEALSGKTP